MTEQLRHRPTGSRGSRTGLKPDKGYNTLHAASHVGRLPGRTGAGRGVGPGRRRGRSLPGSGRNHPPHRPTRRPGAVVSQRQRARHSAVDEPPGQRVADLPGLGRRDHRGGRRPDRSPVEFQRRRGLAGKAPLRLKNRPRREFCGQSRQVRGLPADRPLGQRRASGGTSVSARLHGSQDAGHFLGNDPFRRTGLAMPRSFCRATCRSPAQIGWLPPGRTLATAIPLLREYASRQAPMPVAVVIGGDPAVHLAAAAPHAVGGRSAGAGRACCVRSRWMRLPAGASICWRRPSRTS